MATLDPIVGASPLNSADGQRLVFTADTDGQILSRALGDTPSNFETMDSPLNIRVVWRSNSTDDTLIVRARIVNGATILAAADSGGAFQEVGSFVGNNGFADIDQNADFGFVNTTADKATWDGATLEIQQGINRSMAADNCQIQPDLAEISGTYTESVAAIAIGGTIAPAGDVLFAGLPEFQGAPDFKYYGRIRRAANGHLYTVAPKEPNVSDTFILYKSTDNGATWDQIHTFHTTGNGSEAQLGHVFSELETSTDILHVAMAAHDSVAAEWTLWYAAWDCATDTIEHQPEKPTTVAALNVHVYLVIRTTGEVVIAFAEDQGAGFGEGPRNIVRGNAGGWTLHSSVMDGPDPRDHVLLVDPATDDVHLYWSTNSGNDEDRHRVLRADNTFSTPQVLTNAISRLEPGSYVIFDSEMWVPFDPGGTEQRKPYIRHAAIAESPTWTSTRLFDVLADAGGRMVDVAGGRMVFAWVDDGTQEVKWSEYDKTTDTWQGPVTEAITPGEGLEIQTYLITRAGNVYLLVAELTSSTSPRPRLVHEVLIGAELSEGPSIQPTGSTTPAGSLALASAKGLDGSATPAGTAIKKASSSYTGSVTPAGSVAAAATKILALAGSVATAGVHLLRTLLLHTGSITPSADVSRETRLTETGETTPTGNVSRETKKLLGGDLTLSGILRRTVAKALEATITSTGQTISSILKLLAGSISPAGASSHQGPEAPGSITVGGTLTATGDLLRATAHSIDGLIAPEGILARYIAQIRTGSTTPTGAFGPTTITKIFSSNVTPAGTVSRYIAHLLIGSIEPAATLASKIAKALGSTLTSAATLALEINPSQTSLNLAGSLALAGDHLTRVGKALDGAITPASEITKTARMAESGTLTPAGSVSPAKRAILAISGTLNMAAGLAKTTLKRYAGTITPQTALRRRVSIGIASTLTTTGALVKHSRRTLTAAITFTSTVATQVFNVLAGPISRLIRGQGHAKGIHHQGRTRKDIK